MNIRSALSFLTGKNRFNYRTAAVIIRDNHVLVCREDVDDFVMLPGGRVEFGEASNVALAREIEEELRCVGTVGRLLYTVENFFVRDGENFHEMGAYYAVALPDGFPFDATKPCLVTHDEGHELTFSWHRLDAETLGKVGLMPHWIRARLKLLPEQTEHLIRDER